MVCSVIPPVGEMAAGEAKMAARPCSAGTLQTQPQPQPPTIPGKMTADPTSPAGIAQAVVTLLGPTLTATVDAAVHRGAGTAPHRGAGPGTETHTRGGRDLILKR